MADIIPQRGVLDFGAGEDSDTVTITAVNSIARAVARITNVCFASSGPTAGDTAGRNNDDLGVNCVLTDTTTLTFTRLAAGVDEDVRVFWEVWEDDEQGDNAFIVRHRQDITLAASTTTSDTTVSGISDIDDCVVFITGITSAQTADQWIEAAVQAQIVFEDPNNVIRLTRNNDAAATIVSIVVVEFTGTNWTVQQVDHTVGSLATTETETIDAVVWANTFIVPTFGTTFDNGDDSITINAWPGATTTTVRFRQETGTAGGTGTYYVVENSEQTVEHLDSITGGETDIPAGSASPTSDTRTITSVTLTDAGIIATTAINQNASSQYPRSFFGYRIQDATTIEFWRGRHAYAADWAAQIITFPTTAAAGARRVMVVS